MSRQASLSSCRFGEFAIDASLCELRRHGAKVPIEPKALDLLGYLIRHRDRVVPKAELLGALWPREFVSDDALTYCVKAARRALGDTGGDQQVIATVRGRGYRFVAPVTELDNGAGAPAIPPRRGFFVGREAVMAQVHGALANALASRGRVVLLSGEPGIGKTRTADELAAAAAGRGAQVVVGRCYEGGGAPAFWPWVQVLRGALAGRSPSAALAGIESGAAELVQLVPEIAAWLDTPPPVELGREPSQARFRLFDTVSRFLMRSAAEQPLVVILDDLHWADTPSLLLLQFLAQELAGAALLVIGTYRDVEVGRSHPLTRCVGDLTRLDAVQHVALQGLTAADVARFVEATSGLTPPAALVRTLWEQTNGNPFFVSEIVRLLSGAGDGTHLATDVASIPIPTSVREAVLRRCELLSARGRRLLALASVLGRELDLAVLVRAAPRGDSEAAVLDVLEEAVAARLIEPMAGTPARYRFAHALVVETLYGALPRRERAEHHAQAGAAIEAVYADALEPHLAALAHHFAEAAVLGDTRRAIAYARRAGDQAAHTWAYEDAAAHFERAVALGEQTPTTTRRGGSGEARLSLLLALGDNLWKAGDFARAKSVFQRAADGARRAGSEEVFAQAALGYGGGFRGFDLGVIEPTLVELLEDALVQLPTRASGLRARVMARLAVALYHIPGSLERRKTLSRDAVRLAARSGDDPAHLATLYSRHWAIWGPDDLDDRLATAAAMITLANRLGDQEMALHGHRFHLIDSLHLGDRSAVELDLAACTRLADELRQPYYHWYAAYLCSMRALLDGQLAEAERLANVAVAVGQRAQSENVAHMFGAQVLWIRREQGRMGELEPLVRSLVERYPALPSWRCGLAYVLWTSGRYAEAQAQVEIIAADDFARLPRNVFWLVAMALLADVCASLDHPEHARAVYAQLEPYARCVIESSIGAACIGSAARPLGRLAASLGNWRDAVAHFEHALTADARLGSPHLLAHTQRDYAAALLAHGDAAQVARAGPLLERAAAAYAALGMTHFAAETAALQARLHERGARAAQKAKTRMRLVR